MDIAPIDALNLTGARRMQVFTQGIIPSILPSLLGIALYRLGGNIRSSLVLGFVGAGGIGFELLSTMSLSRTNSFCFCSSSPLLLSSQPSAFQRHSARLG
jgi:phosphonate transport system permease protein